ncbi:ribonuclease H-like domain-containing protein, partial [Tanacetum coccineum]
IYAFLANQPNGSQLVHEDLEQIHEDDLEEIDLKWKLALLSMRVRKYYQRTGKKITINGSDTTGYDKSKVECFNCHKMGHFAREYRGPRNQESRPRNQDSSRRTMNVEDTSFNAMVSIDGAGFDWSFMAEEEVTTNMALALSLEEFQQPEFEGYGPKSVYVDTSNEVKKTSDTPLVEELVSEKEKQTIFPKQQDKTARKLVKTVNTAHPKSTVFSAKPLSRFSKSAQSTGISPTDDQDNARASLDRKSTTGGCQFLRCRLISWQCKKQTVVATSSTEAKYVAFASCCGQDKKIECLKLNASPMKYCLRGGYLCQAWMEGHVISKVC